MPETADSTVPEKRRFDAEEVAEMLGVNVRTVYNMVDRGELDCVKAGRSFKFFRSHLLDYAGSEAVVNDMIAELESADE